MRLTRRSTALGAAVAAVVSLPVVVTVAADAGTDVLLSTGRPVIASSVEAGRYAATEAVDGSRRTRWASAEGPGTQWLRVDLGNVRPVNRVRIVWAAAYAKAYQVQLSDDGANWRSLHATRAGNGGTDDLTGLVGAGRYLRVLATERGTRHGYSLWEVQVHGSGRVTPPVTPVSPAATASPSAPVVAGLDDPALKDLAMQLVAGAGRSTPDWRGRYGHIEDGGDGRGYTGGIVGFRTGTSDLLAVVAEYTRRKPANVLVPYLPALREVSGSASHAGLGPGFTDAWRAAAADLDFQQVQRDELDRLFFDPAVALAKADGLRALGQFVYFDAAVMHGRNGMGRIRAAALSVAPAPAQGGDEVVYLDAYLDARAVEMRRDRADADTSRVDAAQRAFLRTGNLDLNTPLAWQADGNGSRVG